MYEFKSSMVKGLLTISIIAFTNSCAAVVHAPASQPSSQPSFVFIAAGAKSPSDGVFMTLSDARAVDEELADKDLSRDQRVADAELAQHDAEKRASANEWLVHWGLPVVGMVGILVGGILGVVAARH